MVANPSNENNYPSFSKRARMFIRKLLGNNRTIINGVKP